MFFLVVTLIAKACSWYLTWFSHDWIDGERVGCIFEVWNYLIKQKENEAQVLAAFVDLLGTCGLFGRSDIN